MLHERNIVLTIKTADVPHVSNSERVKIERLSDTFTTVTSPTASWRRRALKKGCCCAASAVSTSTSRRPRSSSRGGCLRPASRSRMPRWQETLFIWLAGSAEDATTYFQIPSDRVVEIGTQIVV